MEKLKNGEIIKMLLDKIYEANYNNIIEYHNKIGINKYKKFNKEYFQMYNICVGASYQELGKIEKANSFFDLYFDSLNISDKELEEVNRKLSEKNNKKTLLAKEHLKFTYLINELNKLGLNYKVKGDDFNKKSLINNDDGINLIEETKKLEKEVEEKEVILNNILNSTPEFKNDEELYSNLLSGLITKMNKKEYSKVVEFYEMNLFKGFDKHKDILEFYYVIIGGAYQELGDLKTANKMFDLYLENVNLSKNEINIIDEGYKKEGGKSIYEMDEFFIRFSYLLKLLKDIGLEVNLNNKTIDEYMESKKDLVNKINSKDSNFKKTNNNKVSFGEPEIVGKALIFYIAFFAMSALLIPDSDISFLGHIICLTISYIISYNLFKNKK